MLSFLLDLEGVLVFLRCLVRKACLPALFIYLCYLHFPFERSTLVKFYNIAFHNIDVLSCFSHVSSSFVLLFVCFGGWGIAFVSSSDKYLYGLFYS